MSVSERMEAWSDTPMDRPSFEGALSDPTLIDIHAHVFGEGSLGREPVTADRMIAWMDEHGIDRTVLLPTESPEASSLAPTWWVLQQAASHPDRLIPFCGVDPRNLAYGRDNLERRLESYVDRGARGFGEHKMGLPIDDERCETVYEVCATHDLPVLLHLDQKSCTDEPGLPGFESVLRSFPEVDFIGHAHGFWAHISGGVTAAELSTYPTGPIAPGGRVDELLTEYPNVYADISAGSGFNALTRDPSVGQAFLERHAESLLFGTDYLAVGQTVPQFAFFERFDLPPAKWERIRFRNAEAILR